MVQAAEATIDGKPKDRTGRVTGILFQKQVRGSPGFAVNNLVIKDNFDLVRTGVLVIAHGLNVVLDGGLLRRAPPTPAR